MQMADSTMYAAKRLGRGRVLDGEERATRW